MCCFLSIHFMCCFLSDHFYLFSSLLGPPWPFLFSRATSQQKPETSQQKTDEIMKSSTIITLSLTLILLPFGAVAARPPRAGTFWYGTCGVENKKCTYWDPNTSNWYSATCADDVCFLYSNTRARANLS